MTSYLKCQFVFQNQNTREHKENIPPAPAQRGGGGKAPPTPEVGLVGKLGSYEERRKRLQDERKREYNEMIAGVGVMLYIANIKLNLNSFMQNLKEICYY